MSDIANGGFTLSGICLDRASRSIFRDLDFRIEPGEIHALVGARNVGKSSLCSLLAGNFKPDDGMCQPDSPGARIAKVTDSAAVFPNLTVGNNLLLARDYSWVDWFVLRHLRLGHLQKWLSSNSIDLPLNEPLQALPKEDWLFVQILNRLYHDPALLVLDEALESLSPSRFRQLWPLLESRRDRGMSVLWVTNKIDSALLLADRVSVLRDGKILMTEAARRLDRLSLMGICHGFLETSDSESLSEKQFHQMMRFTEALLRDLPSAVCITDMEHVVRFVNQSGCAFFGIPKSWNTERSLEDMLGHANARLSAMLRQAFNASSDREWHSLPIQVDGDQRLVDIRMRLIKEGEISIGYIVVIEDVSMREEMRQRLILSENLASVGLLAAGVAHEVNNPLEAMENYLTYLSDTEAGRERREILGQVCVEANHIKETVKQLVAFSGHRDGRRVKTDMARLAKQLCSLLDYQVKAKGIQFIVREPAKRVLVAAAPNEMRQMLLNLLRNSIDAITDGGTISIAMNLDESNVDNPLLHLIVEDDGIGIEKDNLSDIFVPFISTKAGTGNHQGLGLSIVHSIVENNGGSIGVENIPEGGCRFTVALPCLLG